VLATLFVALTTAGVKGAPSARGGAALAAGILLAAAGALALYVRLRRRARFERFAATIRPVARALRLFTQPHGIPVALLSLLIWLLEGITFAVVARAVGVEISVIAGLAVMAIASLFAAIPAAPGYAGTFDAGIVVGLAAAGVKGGDAVAVLLLARFMLFVPVTLAGAAALVAGYGGFRRRAKPRHEQLEPYAAGEPILPRR
jgi:uncharacterized protein (TIRG00374 family)